MTHAESLQLKLCFDNRPPVRNILRLWFPRMSVYHFKRRRQFSITAQAFIIFQYPAPRILAHHTRRVMTPVLTLPPTCIKYQTPFHAMTPCIAMLTVPTR